MRYFIDVILPIPLQKLFTYSITAAEAEYLKPGMRVSVPFGKSKMYTGLVYQIHTTAPVVYEAKEIHQILDEIAIVTPLQLKFWEWISNYYMCTMGDVMRAALPNAFILESETMLTKTEVELDESDFKDDEFLVYEALHHQSSLKVHDVMAILDKKSVLPVIKRLIDKDAIAVKEEVFEKYKPKLVRYVKLSDKYASEAKLQQLLEDLSRAPKQREVVLNLFSLAAKTRKPVKVTDLKSASNTSSTIIKSLIDKTVLEAYFIQTDRVNYSGAATESSKVLNTHQEKALLDIKATFKTHNTKLFYSQDSFQFMLYY